MQLEVAPTRVTSKRHVPCTAPALARSRASCGSGAATLDEIALRRGRLRPSLPAAAKEDDRAHRRRRTASDVTRPGVRPNVSGSVPAAARPSCRSGAGRARRTAAGAGSGAAPAALGAPLVARTRGTRAGRRRAWPAGAAPLVERVGGGGAAAAASCRRGCRVDDRPLAWERRIATPDRVSGGARSARRLVHDVAFDLQGDGPRRVTRLERERAGARPCSPTGTASASEVATTRSSACRGAPTPDHERHRRLTGVALRHGHVADGHAAGCRDRGRPPAASRRRRRRSR